MPTKKKIDEQEVEKAEKEAMGAGLSLALKAEEAIEKIATTPTVEYVDKETSVVMNPYMAVQGAPVAATSLYVLTRGSTHVEVTAPQEWVDALSVYMWDYGYVDVVRHGKFHDTLLLSVASLYPVDEIATALSSMLKRMEEIYHANKESK